MAASTNPVTAGSPRRKIAGTDLYAANFRGMYSIYRDGQYVGTVTLGREYRRKVYRSSGSVFHNTLAEAAEAVASE